MKAKLESFRANIRRERLETVFASKRILLLEEKDRRSKETSRMEEELNLVSPLLPDLKHAAALSQSEAGIRVLLAASYDSLLLPFLAPDRPDDEQFYASYIASNLYFLATTTPAPQLTEALLVLLQEGSVRVRENCLCFLENTLVEFPEWREELVRKGLCETLRQLFMVEKATKNYLLTLMSVVYRLTVRSNPHPSLPLLRKPLCQIALNALPQDADLIKRALLCLDRLLQMLPEETAKFLNQCRVIVRLCGVGLRVGDASVVLLTLQLIRGSLETMDSEVFLERVMPFLRELESSHYEVGGNSQKQSLSGLRLQSVAYEVIYQALEAGVLSVDAFCVDPMAASMLAVYESTSDELLVHPLAFSFAIVLTQAENMEGMKQRIAQQLHRTR